MQAVFVTSTLTVLSVLGLFWYTWTYPGYVPLEVAPVLGLAAAIGVLASAFMCGSGFHVVFYCIEPPTDEPPPTAPKIV
jgi:hypothetical protein